MQLTFQFIIYAFEHLLFQDFYTFPLVLFCILILIYIVRKLGGYD